jgi:hypothetical protein
MQCPLCTFGLRYLKQLFFSSSFDSNRTSPSSAHYSYRPLPSQVLRTQRIGANHHTSRNTYLSAKHTFGELACIKSNKPPSMEYNVLVAYISGRSLNSPSGPNANPTQDTYCYGRCGILPLSNRRARQLLQRTSTFQKRQPKSFQLGMIAK